MEAALHDGNGGWSRSTEESQCLKSDSQFKTLFDFLYSVLKLEEKFNLKK